MSDTLHDIPPNHYAPTLREMLRHENDLTNHRLMWLLVGQGFIANAYISAGRGSDRSITLVLPLVGILLTLSAFLLLYKSYEARGYIEFLGARAKKGTLKEEDLPLKGWPRRRIKGWWKDIWVCPWMGKPSDVFEPWLFLPYLFMFTWVTGFLENLGFRSLFVLLLAISITTLTFVAYCIIMVWSQGRDLRRAEARTRARNTDDYF